MVQILGGDYSLTIVVPFALILAGIVFFITVYIKDNIGKLKIKIKHHKRLEKKILTDFSKEYSILKKKISSSSTAESIEDISFVIKKYIAESLNIEKEFSFEDLPRDKLEWPVIEFTKRLSDLKYSGREITKAEISHLMLYLSKILRVKSFHEARTEKIVSKFKLIKFPKIEFKFPHFKHIHHEHVKEIKPHKQIKPLDLGLPKKITLDFSWLFKKKGHKIESPKQVKVSIPIKVNAPEPEHHKVHHHHKPSIFERIRINSQSRRILNLIRKAEGISLRNPLLSRKLYNEALIMYYKLPIDKEEDIAIKLNKFYEKVDGKHEIDLINIKHQSKKETKEAIKHLHKYRNYVVIEANSFNNKLRKSIDEVKRSSIVHMGKTKNKHVKSRLYNFLKHLSKNESSLFSLEESSVNHLLNNASSLLKTISREESKEAHDEYLAIKNLFSHMKVEHRLPKAPMPIVKHEEIKKEIQSISDIKEVPKNLVDSFMQKPHEKPVRINPPEVRIAQRKKIVIAAPTLPEKKISDRMRRLMEEKESVYNKLKEVEGKELDRFKQTRRMPVHEDIGYHDFISELKSKSQVPEEHRIKKIFEAK